MLQTKDPFEKVPELLAALTNVKDHGFFEIFRLEVGGVEENVLFYRLYASGFIPNNEKYMAEGCGMFVDPDTIIEKLREIAKKGKKFPQCTTKIESSKWESLNVKGSKGQKINLSLSVYLA